MSVIIFEISASMSGVCMDGRNYEGIWGHEKQFHATRESAEAACLRLRNGGYWGCPEPPTYSVVERIRENYPADELGEQEWRHALKQAGIRRDGKA
jgi:hypothetical protein